jgi:hypothetical protein
MRITSNTSFELPMSVTSPVSIHPYFKVHPGKLDASKTLLPRFIEKTAREERISITSLRAMMM